MPKLLASHTVATLRATIDALVHRVRGGERTAPPPRAQVGGPLDVVNDAFHEAYDRGRVEAHRARPVFVVLADTLVFVHGDVRTKYSFAPRTFHVIKSIAHVPVALYAALLPCSGNAPDEAARGLLLRLQRHTADSLARLGDEHELDARTQRECREVLERSLPQIQRALDGRVERPELDGFAEGLGALLLSLIHTATALQLSALHAHVEAALGPLGPREREALHVVVTGDHQARTRSLGMQYFRKRLDEPSDSEHRLTYAEGVSDEQGALALVGTHRLDRAVAHAFFGDEQRLQRDILGDAAHQLLSRSELSRIA